MGLSAGMASLIGGGISAAGSVTSGILGSGAAKSAAAAQQATAQQGIALQKQIFDTQQQNMAPYMQAGNQSLAQLLGALTQGHFGVGSSGEAPTFQGGTFAAPSLDEARHSPGYQFTAEEGTNSIMKGAAAAGGAISGGTLKALDSYNTGLADSTYNDVFNRSLSTYNAGLSKYQADLAGYGAKLQGNQQEFNQLFAPSQLGENAVSSINNSGSVQGANISNLLAGLGNAQASGIVGSTNQLTAGLQGGLNSLGSAISLPALLNQLKGTGTSAGTKVG